MKCPKCESKNVLVAMDWNKAAVWIFCNDCGYQTDFDLGEWKERAVAET